MRTILFTLLFCRLASALTYSQMLEERSLEQRQSCAQALATFEKETLDLQPLTGGWTRARLYKFASAEEQLVLRFLDPKQSREWRLGEIEAYRIASELGIGPRLHYGDPEGHLLILRYVEGRSLTREDIRSPEILTQLGQLLARLHAHTGSYPHRYPLYGRAQRIYRKAQDAGIPFPSGFDQEMAKLKPPDPSRSVPCHGDLNLSNIIVGPSGLTVIDWTTASWDDPATDLAYFLLWSYANAEQANHFLTAYYRRPPTQAERASLASVDRLVRLCASALWFRFSDEPSPDSPSSRIAALDAALATAAPFTTTTPPNLTTASPATNRSFALSCYASYLNTG